jgi:hypothetical protein
LDQLVPLEAGGLKTRFGPGAKNDPPFLAADPNLQPPEP